MTRLRADLILLLVAVVWGSAFAAQRVAALNDAVFLFNGLRFLLGVLVLLPFTGMRWGFSRKDWGVVGLSGLILFVASALQQAGIRFTTAGNAGFITSLYVVIVPLILAAGWKEKPHPVALVAAAVAAAGGFLLSTGGQFIFQLGDMLVLGCAFFFALHVIVIGKMGAQIHSLRFASGQFMVAGALSLLTGLFVERPAPEAWPAIWGGVLFTGIFSVGIGYTLQVVAQKHTPPTDAAIILGLESVFAVIGGWLYLGELLLPIQIVGCVLILAAVVMAQVKDFRWGNAAPASTLLSKEE